MRKNKSKKEIVSDIQLVQDAERRRALIRDVIFPYLSGMNENIGYTKVFLGAISGLINGIFDETRKTTTIGQLTPKIDAKLEDIFKKSDPNQKKELEKYSKLIVLLKDISIQDLTYATELPRFLDGYMLRDRDKELISSIDINKILG